MSLKTIRAAPRLLLKRLKEEDLSLLAKSEETFARTAQLDFALGWSEFPGALPYALCRLQNEPNQDWWKPFLLVMAKQRRVIGLAGFKGPPEEGCVEIGYCIAPSFRSRGYGTEAAKRLIGHALKQPGITKICAHTLPKESPSTSILIKCGLQKVRSVIDPEDGPLWRWELSKDNKIPIRLSTSLGVFVAWFSPKGLARLDFPGPVDNTNHAEKSFSTMDEVTSGLAERTASAIQAVLKSGKPENLPPFDLEEGTDFQRTVWAALRQIPPGQTWSYSELAKKIGRPKAVRAVGGACGANPIPLLIPCHRVLAKNRKIGGFSGGIHWKERLLALEGVKLNRSSTRQSIDAICHTADGQIRKRSGADE
jgi:[ribosomal protein S5]-alanine N-acetyltransferase